MAKKPREPGAGDVPILLGDERVILKPSLDACRAINKLAGNSLAAAVDRIMNKLDFEFIVEIVLIGMGESSPHIRKEVAERIYRQGVVSIAGDCVLFVRVVTNGGVRPAEDPALRSLQNLDALLTSLPDKLTSDEIAPVEALRARLIELLHEEEAGEDAADPLPESESQSEIITTE